MLTRKKRAVLVAFLVLLTNDISRLVNMYLKNGSPKLVSFSFFYSSFENFKIFHLSLMYMLAVMTIYFIFNFFKKEKLVNNQ